jgi:hypothetical protein
VDGDPELCGVDVGWMVGNPGVELWFFGSVVHLSVSVLAFHTFQVQLGVEPLT